ncbi:MAG: OmpA family protein [Saprospiraceae bacterium]|nr:OmpA family protein [Saprospiraceae bacterium]
MRKFLGSFCMMICISISSYGQNPQLKSGIVFKKLFLDYQSQNGGSISKFDDYRHGFEIGFQRMLTDKVALNIPLRYGVVDSHLDSINCLKKTIASIDAQFQYQFIEPGRKVIPYVLAGLGGVYEKEGEFNLQVPAGLGFYFRLAPNAFINIQSEFRYSFSDNRNNLQHGIGFTYLIGKVTEDEVKPKPEMAKPDSDNDGIPDELDLCPNAFGSKELNGCPDKDGDGVADYLDKCPEVKGLKEFGGCPDSDNDGISDNEDECPKVAGPASNKGCPVKIEEPIVLDSDGDGVEDSKDKCPKEKGSIASMGCPDADGDGIPDKEDKCPDKPGLKIYYGCPDTDGDGIDDSRDKCPNIAGTVANEGCPEIKKEDKKTLEVAMQAVQFQTGSAVLKPESSIVLTQIADIMSRYPDFNMTISGHTDNTGSASANQTLSEKRAKSCFDFLIKKGVAAVRMSFAGYGESRPISTNDNEKGRTFNRRVEFNLIPRQ